MNKYEKYLNFINKPKPVNNFKVKLGLQGIFHTLNHYGIKEPHCYFNVNDQWYYAEIESVEDYYKKPDYAKHTLRIYKVDKDCSVPNFYKKYDSREIELSDDKTFLATIKKIVSGNAFYCKNFNKE